MKPDSTSQRSRIPIWVWVIAFGLASTQPLLCIWLVSSPPRGLVSSGLHIPDSALFLHAMRMFRTSFESLYATCQSTQGDHGIAFFPLPHLWLYGLAGLISSLSGGHDFIVYGFANGIGAFVFLMVVYWLLREAAPKQANLAFLLYSLSGGLGGVLYILTAVLRLQRVVGFEDCFRRFALYELFEGAHLQPITCLPRLYYTLSLALCLASLVLLIQATRGHSKRMHFAAILMPIGTFIDLRYGVFTLGLATLYLWLQDHKSWATRFRYLGMLAASAALGAIPATLLLRANPVAIQNHLDSASHVMWFSPFLSVAILHMVTAPPEILKRIPRMRTLPRMISCGFAGYLVAFAVLFAAYQVWYGNILVARDSAAPTVISDGSLLGLLAGVFAGAFWKRDCERVETAWIVVWFLTFTSIAISAFGQGWFLRFGPQRIQILIWAPLCILSATRIQVWRSTRPNLAKAILAAMLLCGACSAAVAMLCFQGPLGLKPPSSPYASFHAEAITIADGRLMDRIGNGVVLAPPPLSDSIAALKGNHVVFGVGSFNCSEQRYITLKSEVDRFFSSAATDSERRDFVRKYCADYVFCSDTWPAQTGVIEALDAASWLEKVAEDGLGVLYRVRTDQVGSSSG